MKIVEMHSHLNGWEFLMVHKPQLWEEILSAIADVNAERCKAKVSREKRTKGALFYSPKHLNSEFKRLLKEKNWHESRVSYWVTADAQLIRKTLSLPPEIQKQEPEIQKQEIEAAGGRAIRSYNQTDFVKERVAVEVQFGKYAFVAYDLFVKHLAFYVGDQIDVGIEILPMKSLQTQMSSGVAYYESELYNVIRQGRGVPAVPLVLIGVGV